MKCIEDISFISMHKEESSRKRKSQKWFRTVDLKISTVNTTGNSSSAKIKLKYIEDISFVSMHREGRVLEKRNNT